VNPEVGGQGVGGGGGRPRDKFSPSLEPASYLSYFRTSPMS
jgi:hypothetical protein